MGRYFINSYNILYEDDTCRLSNKRGLFPRSNFEISLISFFPGERYVYKFVCDPEALFSMARTPAPCDVISHLYYPPYLPTSTATPTEYPTTIGRRFYENTQFDNTT